MFDTVTEYKFLLNNFINVPKISVPQRHQTDAVKKRPGETKKKEG
jgi:hypothetical protein